MMCPLYLSRIIKVISLEQRAKKFKGLLVIVGDHPAEMNLARKESMDLWHFHLGHANEEVIKSIVKKFHLLVCNNMMERCKFCVMGKMH